ncbi:NAD(P)-binding domain-containing protein [Paenibacillus sp. FSL M7-1455]|uniref:NADPH-dependent F420 reductase n=1 Tax=unclassified Paenibacillus TaxID=185978 RepID=UPI0030D70EC3
MNIGIIGAGVLGSTLAKQFVALGYQVNISNSRGPDTLADVAVLTGASPVTIEEAVRGADLIILAIPFIKIASLPRGVFDLRQDKAIIIDASNYVVQRDGRIEQLLDGSIKTESRWVEQHIGAPVVKAFNHIVAQSIIDLAKPEGVENRIALSVFADDPASKAVVMKLIDTLGFDPVDGGTIDDSWRVQIGTPTTGVNLNAIELKKAISEATVEQNNNYRTAALESSQS